MPVTQIINSGGNDVVKIGSNNIQYGGVNLLNPIRDTDILWLTDVNNKSWATAMSLDTYLKWHRIESSIAGGFNTHFYDLPEYNSSSPSLTQAQVNGILSAQTQIKESSFLNDFIISGFRMASIGGMQNVTDDEINKVIDIYDPSLMYTEIDHMVIGSYEDISKVSPAQLSSCITRYIQYIDEFNPDDYQELLSLLTDLTGAFNTLLHRFDANRYPCETLKCYQWDSSVDLEVNRNITEEIEVNESSRIIVNGSYATMGGDYMTLESASYLDITEDKLKSGDRVAVVVATSDGINEAFSRIVVTIPEDDENPVIYALYPYLDQSTSIDLTLEVDKNRIYVYPDEGTPVMVRIHSVKLLTHDS